MKLISTNPSKNYEKLGEVDVSTQKEIEQKVMDARSAMKSWRNLGIDRRIEYVQKVIAIFEKKAETLMKLMADEMGMPIEQTEEDVHAGIEFLRWYCDNAHKYLDAEIVFEDDHEVHKVLHEPRGVAAVIVPWNFPMSNVVWQMGQNLVAGNVVVLKHSEETPLFGKAIEEVFHEAGFPEGVFSEVYGPGTVGDILIHQDIDMICFTGSTKTAQYLYSVAAEKMIPILMELGGSAPGIVFEDADVDDSLEMIFNNRFANCGQICDGLKRLIVHEDRMEEVVEKLTRILENKKVGEAQEKDTDIGPLVAKRQLDLLKEQVVDAIEKGAGQIFYGKLPTHLKGAYYEPSLLVHVTSDMRVWKEEVFGPVLPIVSFSTEEEAIALANDTQYGLGGYIFTKDKERFLRVAAQIQTGMVSQNNISYVRPCNPFGGYKKSGLGREHGRFGFHEVTQIKLISMEK